MVECLALLPVVAQQFVWRQHLLLVLRELALVEIAVEVEQLLCRKYARFLARLVAHDFLTIVPPVLYGLGMLHLHRFGFAEVFVAVGHIQAIKPSFFGAEALGCVIGLLVVEEKDIGGDAGVGRKDGAGQTDDGVQVELAEQVFLDGQLCAVGAKEESVWDDDAAAAARLEPVHDEGDEEVGGFAAAVGAREVALHAGAGASAVGRVHPDDIYAVALLEVAHVGAERVAMADVGRFNVVQQQVGDAQQIRQRFPWSRSLEQGMILANAPLSI